MRQLNSVLVISKSEWQLSQYKYLFTMFGIAEHVQLETNCTSAMHYLQNTRPLPGLIMISACAASREIKKFVSSYEKLSPGLRCGASLIFIYHKENMEEYKNYGQMKHPLNMPELMEKLGVFEGSVCAN